MDAIQLGKEAGAVGLVVKALVDLYRWSPIPSPRWTLPTAAVVLGFLAALGLDYVSPDSEVGFTGRWLVHWLIVGIAGGGSAIVITELHDWVRGAQLKKDGT